MDGRRQRARGITCRTVPVQLAAERRFYFRSDRDTAAGATAGSVEELEHHLRSCRGDLILHHCAHGDLSRWVTDVLGEQPLGRDIAGIEDDLRAGSANPAITRVRLLDAIHRRGQR
ncbi:MAG: hypothetical protein QOJ69_414 [Actinomycetota bacterium]|jgi:hypothetical protein|nr:hypothetical protein [Actinomycetota bacterium]